MLLRRSAGLLVLTLLALAFSAQARTGACASSEQYCPGDLKGCSRCRGALHSALSSSFTVSLESARAEIEAWLCRAPSDVAHGQAAQDREGCLQPRMDHRQLDGGPSAGGFSDAAKRLFSPAISSISIDSIPLLGWIAPATSFTTELRTFAWTRT